MRYVEPQAYKFNGCYRSQDQQPDASDPSYPLEVRSAIAEL